MSKRLRVVVADDSAFMRGAISRILAGDSRFHVVGQARDGEEAVRLVRELSPDVISMDYNMPGMDGARAARAILAERSIPIVMVSAHTREGTKETVAALAAGAVDFVTKPAGEVTADLGSMKQELCEKLVLAASTRPQAGPKPLSTSRSSATPAAGVSWAVPGFRVIVIASSTGGPAALAEVVPWITLGSRAALIVVQHLPAGYTAALAAQLEAMSHHPIREARAEEELAAGVALVAPGGTHLEVGRSGLVALTEHPPVHGVRPAADVTFKSVAETYGARAIGLVMTGMGRDGALGLAAIKAAGGRTLAQDRTTSTVYGMPRAAVELGVVDQVLSLQALPDAINRLLEGKTP